MITKIMMRDFGVQKFQPAQQAFMGNFKGTKQQDDRKTSLEQSDPSKGALAGSETLEAQQAYSSVKRRRKRLIPGDVVTEAYMKATGEREKLNESYNALLEDLSTRRDKAESKVDATLKTAFAMQKAAEEKISKAMELYKTVKGGSESAIDDIHTVLKSAGGNEILEEYDACDNLLRRSIIKDNSLQAMEEFSNGKKVAEINVVNNSEEAAYRYKAGNKTVEFGDSYKGEPYHIKFMDFDEKGSVKITLEKTHILSLSHSKLTYREASDETGDWTQIALEGGELQAIDMGKTVDNKDITSESMRFHDLYGARYPICYYKFDTSKDNAGETLVEYTYTPYVGPAIYAEINRDEEGNIIKKEITPGYDGVYTEYVNDREIKSQTSHSYRENGRILYESK